jgi:hypothetical protein
MNEEKLRQGKQAAFNIAIWGMVLSGALALGVGLFFAESEEPLLRRAHWIAAGFGVTVTFTLVIHILTQDIAQHHYRENLKAEGERERVNAEIAELEARAALYAAKERAIYTPLPSRSHPRLPEAPERASYFNGERVGDAMEEIEEESPMQASEASPALQQVERNRWVYTEPEPAREIEEPAPGVSARGQTVITESAAAYELRLARLAREIYDLCRDVNPPTQGDIEERIPRTKKGLLRSHDDITKALNILAARGLIEQSLGQGIKRYWLDEKGGRLPATPKHRKGAINSNVPVSRVSERV